MKRAQSRKAEASKSKRQIHAAIVEDALSHPMRVRILGWMRHQPPSTQSEIGKALGVSNAAARYHLKVLESAELVTLKRTRPGPNGITEKLYACNSDIWKRISDQPRRAEKLDFMLDYTFASIHEIQRKALEMIKAEWRWPFLAGSAGAFATPAEIHVLKAELEALMERFYEGHQDSRRTGAVPLAMTFAVLPSSTEDAQAWAGERVFDWQGT